MAECSKTEAIADVSTAEKWTQGTGLEPKNMQAAISTPIRAARDHRRQWSIIAALIFRLNHFVYSVSRSARGTHCPG